MLTCDNSESTNAWARDRQIGDVSLRIVNRHGLVFVVRLAPASDLDKRALELGNFPAEAVPYWGQGNSSAEDRVLNGIDFLDSVISTQ